MTEQERQDEFVEIVGGRRRADQLSKISQNSYPAPTWSCERGHHQLSRREVFIIKSKRERFTDKQINAFLSL